MDNVTKALALARLGLKVFPVNHADRAPLTSRGFYEATCDDFELIATWFTLDHNEATTEVGVWAGGSGVIALDIDKKDGRDGFKSIKDAGHKINETEHYTTASKGKHYIWQTDRLDLTLGKNVTVGGEKLDGVDVRAGGSYFVWWGDEVPESREAFSSDVPAWVLEAATPDSEAFAGEGFSGSTTAWLDSLPDDLLPSGRVRNLIAAIPEDDFGHNEMVEQVWTLVRLGSERETGIRSALDKLRDEWLRGKYNTSKNRRDFELALRGAINKGGRVQFPVPAMTPFTAALSKANDAGAGEALRKIEAKVSETDTEIDFARARREMFKIAAEAFLTPATALGIITGSKAFKHSKASIESTWFGDGEPFFHEKKELATEEEAEEELPTVKMERESTLVDLAAEAEAFTFLSMAEKILVDSKAYEWFGTDYMKWIQSRLKHFNKPYHVASMWAALSVIASPWGKVPLSGAKATDCNLYIGVLGLSSTGKTESWEFGTGLIDAFYGTEASPIIGDVSKLSALALHRALILRDGEPSLVYGDEIQSFFQGVQGSQWQSGILGDLSSHYGGNVAPKLTLNDKDISGKRAKTMLTTFLTGIVDQTLDAVSLSHWTNGFFYRFLWGFGNPRVTGDYDISMETITTSYTSQMDDWAREFKRVQALQEVLWGPGRLVLWEDDALKRMILLKEQIDIEAKPSPLYDSVFVNANGRFIVSIMKAATIVAMTEASEKVTLRHALIAISFAGPWHKSMMLAVGQTGREPFEREVERCLTWIRRNAIKQVGKPAFIQRSAVMRAFRPNEVADRYLRQLTEEGWLTRNGDIYTLTPTED